MLSRVAETLYWIGRYLERAENTARLVSVNTNVMLDLTADVTPGWEPIINLLGCREAYFERHPEITERRVVHFLIAERDNPGSIIATLALARENARTVREVLPREVWEYLNELFHETEQCLNPSVPKNSRHAFLTRVIRGVHTITGMLAGSMNHDPAFAFMNLGRKLERADMTTRIIDIHADATPADEVGDLRPFNDAVWMTILKTLGAYQMYRQSMQVRLSRRMVLDFLFKHAEFPRAIAYCFENIRYRLVELPNSQPLLEQLAQLDTAVMEADFDAMTDSRLHNFIDDIQIGLHELDAAIGASYFLSALNAQSQSQAA